MYGLRQPGIITNQQLVPNLISHGYIQSPHRHGPFVHETRSIMFALVVDKFVPMAAAIATTTAKWINALLV
jgi:hypothetical protein